MIWELDMDITRIFLFPLNLWCLHYKIGFSATHNHSILFYFSEQNCIKQKIASVNYFSLQEDPLIIQILSPPWRSWIVYLFRWKNIHIFRTSHYDAMFPNDTFYMKPVNNSWEWLFFFFSMYWTEGTFSRVFPFYNSWSSTHSSYTCMKTFWKFPTCHCTTICGNYTSRYGRGVSWLCHLYDSSG